MFQLDKESLFCSSLPCDSLSPLPLHMRCQLVKSYVSQARKNWKRYSHSHFLLSSLFPPFQSPLGAVTVQWKTFDFDAICVCAEKGERGRVNSIAHSSALLARVATFNLLWRGHVQLFDWHFIWHNWRKVNRKRLLPAAVTMCVWAGVRVCVCMDVYVVCGLSKTNSICVAYFLGQCWAGQQQKGFRFGGSNSKLKTVALRQLSATRGTRHSH